jgi:hypothetical protein
MMAVHAINGAVAPDGPCHHVAAAGDIVMAHGSGER